MACRVAAHAARAVADFRALFDRTSGEVLSERQAYRWLAGEIKTLPYPRAQNALESLFGEPAERLLGPPDGLDRRHAGAAGDRDLIASSAERARDFVREMELTNVGPETLDELADELRRLSIAYPQQPLATLVDDIVALQRSAFELLGGRQPPRQTIDLYLVAGISSGLMARASHDLGEAREALTHARAAYVCAENAGHDGLRCWTRGLQSLVTYWAGRLEESVRYAEQAAEPARRSHGSAALWVVAGQARSLAALGRVDDARAAIERAAVAREVVRHDELDELGGLCAFSRPRQLYYAADALARGGADEAGHTEQLAREALAAYETAGPTVRAFGDEAGTRCALAIARIRRHDIEGAADAMAPVLALPPARRIHGIVTSVEHVGDVLAGALPADRVASELSAAMQAFRTERLALPG